MNELLRNMESAGRLLAGWQRVLMCSHERPDGDALGCLIGLSRMLGAAGKCCRAVVFGAVPPRFAGMPGAGALEPWDDRQSARAGECDGVILVDSAALNQLAPIGPLLRRRAHPVMVIDHHVTRDVTGDVAVVDETASSASLLVFEMARHLGWTVDLSTAEALFTGIATDTGWFRFSSTDGRTLDAAGQLVRLGVAVDAMYQSYYLSATAAGMKLLGRLLCNLQLHHAQRVAAMEVTQDLLRECGAQRSDLEELVNEPMRLGAVECSILLLEIDPSCTKVSLRSKALVDCAALAARFGGGGHVRAAGVTMVAGLADARNTLLAAVADQLSSEGRNAP